ncbi:MAG TPA: pre-peptidase C-terminal domain-containing protein, partial [Pyrinomonadaceae bacterium]|nr:pre-peptidase C-terminal domain-containing protein [Pyrinomonadaceae bacterium]
MSSPRFGVAPAARAASSAQQKQVAGKVGATRPKESLRPAAATNVKPGGKASGKSLEGVHVETVCSQNQPITFGTPVNGTLANGDCLNPIENDGSLVDEYTFTGTAGQQVAVSMTSNVFDTFLYLLNPNGSVLAANDDIDPNSNPANTNSRIPVSGFITLPSSGTYSILANSFAPESRGAYTLTLTSGSTCNQTPTPININTTVNGTLANGDCTNPIEQDGTFVDFYSFNATAGQQVSVTLTSANFNAFVYLIMPNGDVVADNDGGGGTNARLPQGAGFGRLPITGTYTIIVNSLNVGESGSYSLSLSIAGSPCPSTPITTGQTLNGALADTDCHLIDDGSLIDAYTFSGTTGQAVVISMNSTDATLHPFVHLLAPDGSTVAVDGSQTGSSARIPTSGSFTLPSTGTYTILANSFAVGQTGAYTISLVNPSACTTVLSPTSLDVSGVGGTFNVTATTQPGCSLNAVSNVPWLVINTASINSNGVGTVNYTVAQNTTSAARTGTLTINGQTFTVNQGAACTYAVYPTVRPFREDGGTGRFTVITTSSCPWT